MKRKNKKTKNQEKIKIKNTSKKKSLKVFDYVKNISFFVKSIKY